MQLGCYREIVRAVGGSQRLTSIDFDPIWAPEGHKGFVSDDVCAALSPEMFRSFSAPYKRGVFVEFGPGRMHNCGPHPAAQLYLEPGSGRRGLNCSFRYSRPEFPKLRDAFRGRGIVEFMFDNDESPEEILAGYEEVAGALAPDAAAVAMIMINDTHPDDEVRELSQALKVAAGRYAREMRWSKDSGQGERAHLRALWVRAALATRRSQLRPPGGELPQPPARLRVHRDVAAAARGNMPKRFA